MNKYYAWDKNRRQAGKYFDIFFIFVYETNKINNNKKNYSKKSKLMKRNIDSWNNNVGKYSIILVFQVVLKWLKISNR